MPLLKQSAGYEALSRTNASVVYVTVSGFAERKSRYWFSDYVFIIEVYWTNKKTTYIKRSYDDVLQLWRDLKNYYNNEIVKGLIRSPVFIPKLEGKRLLQKNTIDLAEQRETELQSFFKQLLEGNPTVSSNKVVTEFFCRRPTDPVPSDTSQMTTETPEEAQDEDEDVLFDR